MDLFNENMEKMETMPKTFMKDPVFRRLGEVARYGALGDEERRAYQNLCSLMAL